MALAKTTVVVFFLMAVVGSTATMLSCQGQPATATTVIMHSSYYMEYNNAIATDTTVDLYIYTQTNQTINITIDGTLFVTLNNTNQLTTVHLDLSRYHFISNMSVYINDTWAWSARNIYPLARQSWQSTGFVREELFIKIPPWEWKKIQWRQFQATATGALLAIAWVSRRVMYHYRNMGGVIIET